MIYSFGISNSAFPSGSASDKELLGGKGANLAEMVSVGIPVPPGFTFPCDISVQYLSKKDDQVLFEAFKAEVFEALSAGMNELYGVFGYTPLVSVRSGARVSMPGMMDTILNVGLCNSTIAHWRSFLGDRAALDSYRRLIQMYSSVVLGIPLQLFEELLKAKRVEAGVVADCDLPVLALEELVDEFLNVSPQFPQDPFQQLLGAVFAVFDSWNTDRAKAYRKIYNIPAAWGTAANIQSMVFGNAGDDSCTGVLFTRCPSTGSFGVVGEFLVNAQGEDVVAGIRTPEPLADMAKWSPSLHEELILNVLSLEKHYSDMQDVEFTVQSGKLYILQTRSGKRTPLAAFEIASSLLVDSIITKEEAVKRLSQSMLLGMTVNSIAPGFKTKEHLIGVAAGGSVVSGKAVFTSEDAINCKEPCILIRAETDPDDIAGMNAAVGILTSTGGLTSHAAVVARSMNKACVVGATDLVVEDGFCHTATSPTVNKFSKVTIDGATGRVWFDVDVPVVKGGLSGGALWVLSHLAGVLRVPVEDTSVTALQSVFMGLDVEATLELDAAPFDKNSITNLGVVLEKTQSKIILNMTPPLVFGDKADHLQIFQFGGFDPNAVWVEEMRKVMASFPADIKAKIMLRGSNVGLELFKAAGFTVMGEASTVADLMVDGAPSVSKHMKTKVFGSEAAYDFVVKALKEAGFMSKAFPSSGTYWFEVLQ